MPETSTDNQRQNNLFAWAVILIALLNIFLFFDSFFHFFKCDGIIYFFNQRLSYLSPQQIDHLDNGTTISLVDGMLFRPLFNRVNHLRLTLFGPRYTLWHLSGFIWHMLIILMMLKIVRDDDPDWLDYLLVAAFSGGLVTSHMVTWAHINPYMLFLLTVLLALWCLYISPQRRSMTNIIIAAAAMLTASFLYENGFIISFFFTVYTFFAIDKKRALWLLAPTVIYTICYIKFNILGLNPLNAGYQAADAHAMLHIGRFINAALMAVPLMLMWLFYFCFPSIVLAGEDNIFDRVWFIFNSDALSSPGFVLNILLFSLAVVCIAISISRAKAVKNRWLLLTLTFMLFVYTLIILIGRQGTHDPGYIIKDTGYYTYIFCAYLVIMLHALCDWNKVKLVRPAMALVLIALIAANGIKLHSLNKSLRQNSASMRANIDEIGAFVHAHRGEKDLSFEASSDCLMKIDLDAKGNTCDARCSNIFYPKYTLGVKPKYVIRNN